MENKKVYFITGIDTDAGKSYSTGFLALEMIREGKSVITQKLIQTGCDSISEDIVLHRKIMGADLLPEDMDGTTCPLIFSYPASPHLAAEIDKKKIDLSQADASTKRLLETYDTVLIEGAGGLMVPIEGFYTMADYAAERGLPVILVANPKLGSINHTLLSLETCRNRHIDVYMLVLNNYPSTSEIITKDTRLYLQKYLEKFHPETLFKEVPYLDVISEE